MGESNEEFVLRSQAEIHLHDLATDFGARLSEERKERYAKAVVSLPGITIDLVREVCDTLGRTRAKFPTKGELISALVTEARARHGAGNVRVVTEIAANMRRDELECLVYEEAREIHGRHVKPGPIDRALSLYPDKSLDEKRAWISKHSADLDSASRLSMATLRAFSRVRDWPDSKMDATHYVTIAEMVTCHHLETP